MAKIQFGTNIADGFGGEQELSINGQHTRAVISLGDGAKIIFFGDGLKGTAEDQLKAGTVEKVVFVNGQGDNFVVAEGIYKASNLAEAYAQGDALELLQALSTRDDHIIGSTVADPVLYGFRGDDKINGRGGNDAIVGGRGDDVITGGGGEDQFVFLAADGKGHDVITDFDLIGKDTDVLMLPELEIISTKRANGGDDTMLTLDNGSTILLRDVTRAEFTAFWEMA